MRATMAFNVIRYWIAKLGEYRQDEVITWDD